MTVNWIRRLRSRKESIGTGSRLLNKYLTKLKSHRPLWNPLPKGSPYIAIKSTSPISSICYSKKRTLSSKNSTPKSSRRIARQTYSAEMKSTIKMYRISIKKITSTIRGSIRNYLNQNILTGERINAPRTTHLHSETPHWKTGENLGLFLPKVCIKLILLKARYTIKKQGQPLKSIKHRTTPSPGRIHKTIRWNLGNQKTRRLTNHK
jgi:hypothetical protein